MSSRLLSYTVCVCVFDSGFGAVFAFPCASAGVTFVLGAGYGPIVIYSEACVA